MAWYYIRDDGGSNIGTAVGAAIDTGDGIYSTEKAANGWSTEFGGVSEYFPSMGAAEASVYGAPSDGDVVIYANDHNRTSALPGLQFNQGGAVDGVGLKVYSVNAASDVTQYLPGASETGTNSSNDINLNYNGHIAGVSFEMGDDTFQSPVTVRKWRWQDCTIGVQGSTDGAFKYNQDGSYFILNNVDMNMGNAGCYIFESLGNSGVLEWNGGAITGVAPTRLVRNYVAAGGNGGFKIVFNGVDFSLYQGELGFFGNAATADTCLWRYTGCKQHASATLGTVNSPQQRIEVFGGWGGVQHGFAIKDYSGQANNDDGVYVTADQAWHEGSTVSSIKVVTTANCSHVHPFVFELHEQYIDLGAAGSDVLSVECVSATSGLQSNDIAAFVAYPDAASTITPNWATSGLTRGAGNYGIDPKSTTGNALDAGALGAGDWTGEPGTPSFYKLEVDTTGDPGEAAAVSIRVEVYKPSLTIYLSSIIRAA